MTVDTVLPLQWLTLRRALAELTEAQQQALALRFGCGLGTAEVARVLGTSEAATRRLLAAALARLAIGLDL